MSVRVVAVTDERVACAAGCGTPVFDSGTQRQQAHKRHFREDMVVTAFNFK